MNRPAACPPRASDPQRHGPVVRVFHGPVPLWGSRRGEDVMMTDVLAFDMRVYDPGRRCFAIADRPMSVWSRAIPVGAVCLPIHSVLGALHNDNMGPMDPARLGRIVNTDASFRTWVRARLST